jgi:hypothetical protein
MTPTTQADPTPAPAAPDDPDRRVLAAALRLAAGLGRSPYDREVAEALGVRSAAVLEARHRLIASGDWTLPPARRGRMPPPDRAADEAAVAASLATRAAHDPLRGAHDPPPGEDDGLTAAQRDMLPIAEEYAGVRERARARGATW